MNVYDKTEEADICEHSRLNAVAGDKVTEAILGRPRMNANAKILGDRRAHHTHN